MKNPMFSLFVSGVCRSSGSKTVFPHESGKPIVAPAGKYQKKWQDAVAWTFMQVYGRPVPITGPVRIELVFRMARPRSHYRIEKGRISPHVKSTAPIWHISRPDSGKLRRAVEDALTGLAWLDDSQVCEANELKVYGEPPGGQIKIWEILENTVAAGGRPADNQGNGCSCEPS